MRLLCLIGLAGCAGPTPAPTTVDAPIDQAVSLDVLHDAPPAGLYRGTCDGSGIAVIDADHFVDVSDEDQAARIYRRGAMDAPVQTIDLAAGLGLASDDEADLEELARVDSRIYLVASHGRNTSGELRPKRRRFAALDVTGAVPNVAMTVTYTTELLARLLDRASWTQPNDEVIAALEQSTRFDQQTVPDLAPEVNGTNIEALAAANGRLYLGFRNPRPRGLAIVVAIDNPTSAVTGTPMFGGAALLDLGGLGLRSMTYSAVHGRFLIVAGSHDATGTFALYGWSGALDQPAEKITDLVDRPPSGSPEAIAVYPGSPYVQLVFDQGDADVGGVPCKDAPVTERTFTDTMLHVE